jgi:drug/metabolite transporter (DMT)-like permease
LAAVAIGVTVLLWASAFVAIRHLEADVSPGPLTLGRCLVASLVLGLLLLRQRGLRRPSRGQWMRLLICGVLWMGLYNVTLNSAEQHVDAGTASMLVNLGPILIAVLGALVLRESMPLRLVLGIAVAFAGVVLIGTAASSGGTDLRGVALCLLAAVAYAVSVVTQKPLLGAMSALQVTWTACLVGALVCLPFAPDLVHDVRGSGLTTLGWIVYLGALPTAVAFTTWAYALARSSAARLASTTYLVPPLVIVLGWVALGEAPPLLAVVGGAACLAGVAVARGRQRTAR